MPRYASRLSRRNRSWAREHPEHRDEAWLKREVLPRLDGFPLKMIADATGLSLTACSRMRAGLRTPHPRHWDAFLALVETAVSRSPTAQKSAPVAKLGHPKREVLPSKPENDHLE
jgi:hypothetical protein